jgi:hypothetical protein
MKERERDRQQELHTGTLLLQFTTFEEILPYFSMDAVIVAPFFYKTTGILSSIALLNEIASK